MQYVKLTKDILLEDFKELKLRKVLQTAFSLPESVITDGITNPDNILGSWDWDLENDRLLTLNVSHIPVLEVHSNALASGELGATVTYSFDITPREPGVLMQAQEVVCVYRADCLSNPYMIIALRYAPGYCYTRLEPSPALLRHSVDTANYLGNPDNDTTFWVLFDPKEFKADQDTQNMQVVLAMLSIAAEYLNTSLEHLKDLAELNHLGFLSHNNKVLLNSEKARILTRFLCKKENLS
jgi:hypothetical protein